MKYFCLKLNDFSNEYDNSKHALSRNFVIKIAPEELKYLNDMG